VARPGRSKAGQDRRASLPALTAFDRDTLLPDADYERIDFADLDLAGQDASGARFLECRLARCRLDGLILRRVRVIESLLEDVHGVSVDVGDSSWRDSEVSGGRLGALTLGGATWSGVRVRGSKVGFVSVAGASLEDVRFERCEIGGFDARGAGLRSVAFVDCTVDELNVSGATLANVDLSGAKLRSLIGVESLRGAIVGRRQLLDLAPLLAAQLGVDVRADGPDDPAETPSEV
jgi:uncharacterized protein YjbI with pentapeptide repeats